MDIEVTPLHEEFGARLGHAGTLGDADKADAIFDEIAELGLTAALAVLAVQTRSLVYMLTILRGSDETRALFERTIIDAGVVLDE